MAKERLSPSHPDWIWLQLPMNDLLKERSAPFDAKVCYHNEIMYL